ncbi:MAG TPA: nucleotidyltransferase family protein [Solirubrobacteraceae bacterium]|nr:nucleotidyltransferase family protein [Solirubrobacteraceae bacterium]
MAVAAPSGPIAGEAPTGPWGGAPGLPDIWPTPAQRDLLRATLLPDERALEAWRRIRPLMEPAQLEGTVTALLPQLRVNLQALGCQDSKLELFKGVHRYTWARNQLLLAQAMPVVGALETAGIGTLLLKGAALLAGGRHEGGVRPMTDIDVLVAPDAVDAAVDVLMRHAMTTTDGSPLWYAIGYGQRYRNSWNFQNPAGGQLDLHWHVLHWCRHPKADTDFWAAAETVTLRGVRTRALCPTDEMLTAIAHGVRWDPSPTYRWVLDAALIARSEAIDWRRLAEQAGRRHMEILVGAGLRVLQELAGIEVPEGILRTLRPASPLQRIELRAQTRQPSRRSRVGQAVSLHLHDVRRSVDPGVPVSIGDHLRLAGRRLGVAGPRDLPDLRPGGLPGPGRPVCESAAPIGTGTCSPMPRPWGVPLELGVPENVREHCLYGLWPPDQGFAWIAGREACLALKLPEPAESSLVLTLAAGTAAHGPLQGLKVCLKDEQIGEINFTRLRSYVDEARFLLPERLVRGRSELRLVFRVPRPITPAGIALNDDLRLLGVNLHRLMLRPTFSISAGQLVSLGAGGQGEWLLADGWGDALPEGRLTGGSEARLVMRTDDVVTALKWDAGLSSAAGVARLPVEVCVNGAMVGAVDHGHEPTSMHLPLPSTVRRGELLISWRLPLASRLRRLPGRQGPLAPALVFRSVTLV